MFRQKDFSPRGPSPVEGQGGYVNPKTTRSYHIDIHEGEPPMWMLIDQEDTRVRWKKRSLWV